jgi:DNA-binding PadR family transcriptional regulator
VLAQPAPAVARRRAGRDRQCPLGGCTALIGGARGAATRNSRNATLMLSHSRHTADMKDDPAPEELLPLPPATLHILLALAETDRHGYAIMQDVEARTDGELRLSAGTLYRAVARMVEQGLIVEVEKRRTRADDERRRYYRITSFGQAVARAEVRRLMQLVRHAQARGLTPRLV